MALLLENLRIENYRGFKRLEIPRLGRVNLLVGKNNSGKSSVLEAVQLYATRGAMETVQTILETHDEAHLPSSLKQLFHGRDVAWKSQSEIRIGPTDDDRTLVIGIGAGKLWVGPTMAQTTRYAHVSPHGLTNDETARLWDSIALTDLEAYVTDALRIISPDIERMSFVAERGSKRVPLAKLSTQPRPVALRSLGDGVHRLLGIALSLAYASGGVLLIDEVENGIHFSAQERLWELLFQLAHRLDTQVFATTHSWDCIEAFQKAAKSDEHEEAALIRLDTQNGDIAPVSFNERELAIVTREQIEVR